MATPARISTAFFLGCALLYLINGDLNANNDAIPATYLPANLLSTGRMTFTPESHPHMFLWEAEGDRKAVVRIGSWSQPVGGRPASEWLAAGRLKVLRADFFLRPAKGAPGRYAGTYGPVAGLFGLPLALIAKPFTSDSTFTLWVLGKLNAAALAAGSALFLYWAALTRLSRPRALLLASAYAAGTCAWSVASQAMWPQTPVMFLLSLGAWLFLKEPRRPGAVALCGLALGVAVMGRSTSALALAGVGAYLLWTDRKAALMFSLGGAAPLLLGAAYGLSVYGTPLGWGYMEAAPQVAANKTGSPELWQTPLWLGAAGVLLSPSRGLLVFSPFLAFAAWGLARSARRPEWRPFLPFGIAACGSLLISFKWFDWWGGWSFGYRLVMDAAPLLALLIVPVADTLLTGPKGRAAAGLLVGWSVLVQVLGAFVYEPMGWNARVAGYVVKVPGESAERRVATIEEAAALTKDPRSVRPRLLNIDDLEHRGRLWSVADSQLVYLLTHASESAAARRKMSLRVSSP